MLCARSLDLVIWFLFWQFIDWHRVATVGECWKSTRQRATRVTVANPLEVSVCRLGRIWTTGCVRGVCASLRARPAHDNALSDCRIDHCRGYWFGMSVVAYSLGMSWRDLARPCSYADSLFGACALKSRFGVRPPQPVCASDHLQVVAVSSVEALVAACFVEQP